MTVRVSFEFDSVCMSRDKTRSVGNKSAVPLMAMRSRDISRYVLLPRIRSRFENFYKVSPNQINGRRSRIHSIDNFQFSNFFFQIHPKKIPDYIRETKYNKWTEKLLLNSFLFHQSFICFCFWKK